MTKILSYFLIGSLSLAGCGSDDDKKDILLPQEEEAQEFSTRLSNNLLVAGEKCRGGETVDSNSESYSCETDQWLIRIDNVNTCNADGACTEIAVNPFIAELDRVDRVSIPEYTFFEIDALSPVNASQMSVMNDVLVRFDLNGGTDVVYK